MNLAYKIKTTAPKCYQVKPFQGVVDVSSSGKVEITYVPQPVRFLLNLSLTGQQNWREQICHFGLFHVSEASRRKWILAFNFLGCPYEYFLDRVTKGSNQVLQAFSWKWCPVNPVSLSFFGWLELNGVWHVVIGAVCYASWSNKASCGHFYTLRRDK